MSGASISSAVSLVGTLCRVLALLVSAHSYDPEEGAPGRSDVVVIVPLTHGTSMMVGRGAVITIADIWGRDTYGEIGYMWMVRSWTRHE